MSSKQTFFSGILLACLLTVSATVRAETYTAEILPWSGHWWPLSSGQLVNGYKAGEYAPLQKYDYVTSGTYNGQAMSIGRTRYYDADAESWHGLCYNWAASSILEAEPTEPGIYQGVRFNVGDKKGYLAALYTVVIGTHHDVSTPVAFHQMLESIVRDKKMPVIIDVGTDGEIWTHPIYRYDTSYTQDGNTRHYTTKIYYVAYSSPDYVGTLDYSQVFTYYFELSGDTVVSSGWEGSSLTNPPVTATEPTRLADDTSPTGLGLEAVQAIIQANDDQFRGLNIGFDTAAQLTTGNFELYDLKTDFFKVSLRSGDTCNISLRLPSTSLATFRVYDPNRKLIDEFQGSTAYTLTADQKGDYYLEVVPPSPNSSPAYELSLHVVLAHELVLPLDPAGLWANGLAFYQPSVSSSARSILSNWAAVGTPAGSWNGSSAKRLVGSSTDTFYLDQPTTDGYLLLDSTDQAYGLQAVYSVYNQLLGGNALPVGWAASEVTYPHYDYKNGWGSNLILINLSTESEEVRREGYTADGQFVGSDTLTLEPGEKLNMDPTYSGLLSASRALKVVATSGRKCLLAAMEFAYPQSIKSRALVSCPPASELASTVFVPHIIHDSLWWTGIVITNTAAEDTTLHITAYDAGGAVIGSSEQSLSAMAKFVASDPQTLCPGAAGTIAAAKIEALGGQTLSPLVLYGSRSGQQLAGMALLPPHAGEFRLAHVPAVDGWWTGLGLMNTGKSACTVQFTLRDESGKIEQVTRRLESMQKIAVTAQDLFGAEELTASRVLTFEATNGNALTGIYLIGTNDGLSLMGDFIE